MTPSSEPGVSVSVVVLNYNNSKDTVTCLDSLTGVLSDNAGLSVVVVDNDSSDGSRLVLKDWCDAAVRRALRVKFVQSEENGGYGAGNNRGIEVARKTFAPDWYWILNNDTLLENGAAAQVLHHLEFTQAEMVGMRIHTIGQPSDQDILGGGRLQRWQGRTIMDRPVARVRELDFLSGSSFLVRASLVNQIGGFVEDHFLFWEEIELAARARGGIARMEVVPTAVVNHVGGAKSGASVDGKTAMAFYYSTRSAALYYRRHEGRSTLCFLVLGRLTLALHRLLARRPDQARAVLSGLSDGLTGRMRYLP